MSSEERRVQSFHNQLELALQPSTVHSKYRENPIVFEVPPRRPDQMWTGALWENVVVKI